MWQKKIKNQMFANIGEVAAITFVFPQQHHESTRDQREREAGPRIRLAGKLQLGQRPLSWTTRPNQEVCVHRQGQQFSAEMAAGKYGIKKTSQAKLGIKKVFSDVHLCLFLSCGKKSVKRIDKFRI